MWGKLCILALLAATASAKSISIEDDALTPLFQCHHIWVNEQAAEFKQMIYRKTESINDTDIPWLTEEDNKLILATASKIKPVVVEALNDACTMLSEDGTTELINKTYGMMTKHVQEMAFDVFSKKVKLGDLKDSTKLVDKTKQVIRSVMEFEEMTLSEDEKKRLINVTDQALDILKKLHDGLTNVLYELTIEQYMKFTRVTQRIVQAFM